MLVMEIYGWLSVLFARITGKLTLISPPGLSGCPIRTAGCIVPLKKSEGTKLTSSEGSTKLANFSMCYSAQLYGLLCILRIIWSYVNSVVFADCFICTCITQ
ncbi:hypothetical protein HanRHA438_Chr16g0741521 [Helianthus annuus]|nr:hypothetical protein HanRHA438_Chr16g0741521 [Helianthus annuus]